VGRNIDLIIGWGLFSQLWAIVCHMWRRTAHGWADMCRASCS
jgi:hypothetical protein